MGVVKAEAKLVFDAEQADVVFPRAAAASGEDATSIALPTGGLGRCR